MQDGIDLDITDYLDKFSKLERDMPFIISKALNDVAFEHMRKAQVKDEMKHMLLRNRYMKSESSIRIKRSSKKNLTVEAHHRMEEMGLQYHGGVELPKSKKIAIPNRKVFAQYAGVPKSKNIPKALKIDAIMENAPKIKKGKPRQQPYKKRGISPFILKSGVMIRVEKGSNGLRKLYTFADKARYTKQSGLDFQETMNESFNRRFEKYLNRAYLRVLVS